MILRASLGRLWASFGGPLGDFLGSLDVLLAAVGCLGGPLGVPWGLLGRPWAPRGRFGGFSVKFWEAMLFCRILGRGAALTRRRRAVGAPPGAADSL